MKKKKIEKILKAENLRHSPGIFDDNRSFTQQQTTRKRSRKCEKNLHVHRSERRRSAAAGANKFSKKTLYNFWKMTLTTTTMKRRTNDVNEGGRNAIEKRRRGWGMRVEDDNFSIKRNHRRVKLAVRQRGEDEMSGAGSETRMRRNSMIFGCVCRWVSFPSMGGTAWIKSEGERKIIKNVKICFHAAEEQQQRTSGRFGNCQRFFSSFTPDSSFFQPRVAVQR